MTTSKNHDLFDFMKSISRDMADEYNRIQKRATEDPGTAGDQGEENWATLFKDWLPPTYQIVTKGRIMNHEGNWSPQIDVLVLKPYYPRKLLDKKVYLACGVAAAFECKVTLKASHIEEAVDNCVQVKRLFKTRSGTPYQELHAPIIYGLLAHSHSWKGANSTPLENIELKLLESDIAHVQHPRELLDMLCVADLATWTSAITTFIGPHQVPDWENMSKIYGLNGSASTGYIGHTQKIENQNENFTPIGALISYLSRKLAWENLDYRSFADYYRLTYLGGAGSGKMRNWDSNIYSDNIRTQVELGRLYNGEAWHEWSVSFI